jgi:hypothetical protein
MSEEWIRPKHEPEVIRGMGKRHVRWCNAAIHDAPWTDGDTTTNGGIFIALEMAEQAFQAHNLPYEQGLSNMPRYDPRRFAWFYDNDGLIGPFETEDEAIKDARETLGLVDVEKDWERDAGQNPTGARGRIPALQHHARVLRGDDGLPVR